MTSMRREAEAFIDDLACAVKANDPDKLAQIVVAFARAQRVKVLEVVIKEFRDNYDGADEKYGMPGFLNWLAQRKKEWQP